MVVVKSLMQIYYWCLYDLVAIPFKLTYLSKRGILRTHKHINHNCMKITLLEILLNNILRDNSCIMSAACLYLTCSHCYIPLPSEVRLLFLWLVLVKFFGCLLFLKIFLGHPAEAVVQSTARSGLPLPSPSPSASPPSCVSNDHAKQICTSL